MKEIKYSSFDNTVRTMSSSTLVWTILMYSSNTSSSDYTAQILEIEQNYINITMIMFHCYYGQILYGV